MEDNLPLLPDKDGTKCADVRSILREVFRHVDNVPSTNLFERKDDRKLNDADVLAVKEPEWVDTLSSEYGKLYEKEIKLQYEHAKRLARDTPPNRYHLHSPVSSSDQTWKQAAGLLRRRDLKPTLKQNANCKESLWVKNILNRSSGNVTVVEKTYFPAISNVPHRPFDDGSLQSLSIGEIVTRPAPPTPVVPSLPAAPKHIVSIPSKFQFINFKVGQLHTKCLRLVNISKFEVRISVRPPSRRELDVELCSRLVVTSGSAAEMKIHFRPNDVRPLTEQLDVCVSNGQRLCIPISCFMEPPLLEILINNKGCSNWSLSKSIETNNNIIDLGTKLLGDIHRVEFLLRCSADHASFFLLSEDAWIDYTLEYKVDHSGNGKDYGIEVDSFFISPVRWSGGDDVKGVAVCRATNIGLQTAALRVISSTAISRQLHLVADTIMFTPKHITIQAHEKDYDICSEEDPSCEYYVNLGVAFPHRSLTETIDIINHSPLTYNYYWTSRTWGVCCCWNYSKNLLSNDESDDDLCPGAREAKLKAKEVEETTQPSDEELKEVVVDEPLGCINPCSTIQLAVRVPDVGSELGIQRSVLMYKLILKDIPKESVTEEDECLILSTTDIGEETNSGAPPESPGRSRQVCEVLCAQMEVWWEVVPVRFTLDPTVLRLPHSRRVNSVTTQIRATQLCGVSNIRANLELLGEPPSLVTLTPDQPTLMTFELPLSEKTRHTDVIRLTSEGDEWVSSTRIKQYCDTRHPSITPSFIWLGVFPPGAVVSASLTVLNDTHEDIDWCATVCRWWGERGVAAACEDQPPCVTCHSRACSCSMLTPTRGTLKHSQRDKLTYKVIAPDSDGCVATLVRVQRTDVSTVGPSLDARASLLAYRVLSPRLVLRVVPCYGDKRGACEGCSLDAGDEGTPVLRSRAALVKGGRTCYRLRLTNITPLPTSGAWEPALEGDDVLEVSFQPNEFEVGGYSEIEIMVVLEAKRVTDRRLFIRRARVAYTMKPLYLVIDTAVSGVEVIVELPTGDKETLSFASFKLIQKDTLEPLSLTEPRNDEEIFNEYDLKRKKQQENICYCGHEMVYMRPVERPEIPKDIDDGCHQVEILVEPPPLTRVCPCTNTNKPDVPESCDPYCLQFKQVSVRTVLSRLVVLHNVSQLDTRWRASVRRWPRRHVRTIEKEQWAGDVREPGVVLQCEPSRGDLRAFTKSFVKVSIYADCWGLYHDQILIQIENLEPLILDVWIEAVGLPLEFPLRPNDAQTQPILWLSNTDPERTLLIKNTSRAALLVHAFIVRENEYQQDVLPFRLYMRLFDVPRPVCPCVTYDSENSSISESLIEEMDTSVELLLTPDHGVQDDTFFQMEPSECLMSAGERTSYKLRLLPRHEWAPNTILLLRSTLVKITGDNWYRPEPPLQFVRLRQTQRTSCLEASCSELSVTICALDLPRDDVIRVRKRFHLRNVGDDQLDLHSVTEAPWSVDVARQTCAAHCIPNEANMTNKLKLSLAPRSSTEMVVEVTVRTNEVCPEVDTYSPRSVSSSALCFKDLDDAVLLCIPLILEIEYPVLSMKPETIDFGDVSDGGTKKSYITVSHSSQTKTIYLVTGWTGDDTFRLWPPTLTLRPGTSARIYIEYTACWSSDTNACGTVHVCAQGVRWCAASVHVNARARLCASHSPTHEDYTDDTNLIPRNMLYD